MRNARSPQWEEALFLFFMNESPWYISQALGIQLRSLEKMCHRHNRPDLASLVHMSYA